MVVREIVSRQDRDRFIKFPWKIYGKNPVWVPPLILERREFLDPRKNPFFEHAEAKLYMAFDDGAELGRIAAIVNRTHVETHGERAGFFGLFECVDDQAVASELFTAAAGFLRSRGLEIMRGPENMCVNDDIGLLIQGFEKSPMVMMPYNPAYYARLAEGHGFRKVMDLFAYYGEARDGSIPERVAKGVELSRRRYNYSVRPVRMADFDAEARRIQTVYNAAWQENWGALPMTDREFGHLALNLKQVVDPDLCLIAEVGGEVAGFSLALPDINQALRRINGRLFPIGLIKLLYYKRKIDAARIITMGIIKKYRGMGIDYSFYYETYRRAIPKGIWKGEMSWVLENNTIMNGILQKLGFRVYKVYRLYDLPLLQ